MIKTFFSSIFLFIYLFGIAQENVKVLANWQDPDAPIIAPGWIASKYHDVWGVEIKGVEYAIISTREGTKIIDITNTGANDSLTVLHSIPAAFQGESAVHRDFHDYNGYLYVVCDEGASTLQIIDISNLPEEAKLVYDSNEIITTSHNIFIDTLHAKLYAVGTNISGNSGNLKVMSLADPEKPELLFTYDEGYVHDIYVRDNIGFLNQAGLGLTIVEFTNSSYTKSGTLTEYEDKGYNHSGWLSEDGRYYALCDEDHGYKVKLLDVSDPSDIKVLSLFGSEETENSIPHNVIIKDQYAFVSYYYDGLYVFDISNPEKVETVANYDTYEDANNASFKGVWGVYPNFKSEKILVSDMQTGLYVFGVDLAPAADFTHTVNNSELNLTDASRWQPKTWTWTVNGEEVAYDQNTTYTLSENGMYDVCLTARNSQGTNTKCEMIDYQKMVAVEDLFLDSEIIAHFTSQNKLQVRFNLTGNEKIAYSVSDISGKLVYHTSIDETADKVEKQINLPASLSNNILIFTLQSGNAVWSKKITNIR